MTDDFAIEGEEVGYVPCDDVTAVLVVEEEGAISGMGTGYVPQEQAASSLPAPEREAIVGSSVGFVPKPCIEEDCIDGRQTLVIDDFTRVEATVWGTATGPDYTIAIPAGTWAKTAVFGTSTESVDGAVGHLSDAGGFSASTVMVLPLPFDTSWFIGKDWMECRWLIATNRGDTSWGLYNSAQNTGVFFSVPSAAVGTPVQYGRFQGGGFVFNFSAGTAWNRDGIPFWAALRLDGLAQTVEFKQWAVGDVEPASWETAVSGVALTVGAIVNHRYASSAASPAGTHSIDYIEATVPCSCPWVWQNGFDDGAVGSGRWSISTSCLLSLDVAADAGTDDLVIFELAETAETAAAYASIRAGVTISAVIYVPIIATNTEQPGIGEPTEESGHSISVFARNDPNTVTTRIDAAFRLASASIPGFPDNGLVHLTMFGKQAFTWFPATVGFHTLSLSISPTSTTATVDGHTANLNTGITPPNLAPPLVDMASLAALRIRMGENTLGLAGVFTAQPSLP